LCRFVRRHHSASLRQSRAPPVVKWPQAGGSHGTLLRTLSYTRRSLLRSATGAGLAVGAALPFVRLAGPAKAANTRGIVGVIKPRATDSSLVDMIKLLPDGIGVIPVYLNLTQGSREEYGSAYATYESHIAYLASQKCSLIAIEGAPPFMLLV
jgi:hypothetical protein